MERTTLDYSCHMFDHACAFADCAKFCETEPNNIEHRTKSHMTAGIVNSVFACEVFIKSLLIYQGMSFKDANGHELKTLWSKLKEKAPDMAETIKIKANKTIVSKDGSSFDIWLNNISSAFVDWRYIYEKNSGEVKMARSFLRVFRILLREECCCQLYGQSWKEYVKAHQ